MNILFLTLGDITVASSRTRVYQYFPYFKKHNIGFKALIFTKHNWSSVKKLSQKVDNLFYGMYVLLKLLLLSPFYDVVFIQKVLLPKAYLRLLSLLKKKIVFDFDDSIYLTQQSAADNSGARIKNLIEKRLFRHTIMSSALIIVENNYTKKYAERYNSNIIIIITGPIDTDRYTPAADVVSKGEPVGICIGWIGTPANTPYLKPLFPVFRRLYRQYPSVYFKTIGAAPLDLPDINIRQAIWTLETEVHEFHEFDIGIMPLPDDEWSRSKGGYKLLQYMAIGIPSVASPVGINAGIIRNGENGFLSGDEDEWYERLSFLIANADKRRAMGAKARKIAEQEYSFAIAAPKLIKSLSALVCTLIVYALF